MMNQSGSVRVVALVLLTSTGLWGQANLSAINKQLRNLAPASAPQDPGMPVDMKDHVADAQRPAVILQVAKDIAALPAGVPKVKAADTLAHVATQGEAGGDALQATTDTLAQALKDTPQPVGKDGLPAAPYMDLARLVRYAGTKTSLSDPMLAKADEIVTANQADAAKADFTLKDQSGKKVTLSALRGKIVLVEFWSSDCMTCQKEMQDLDLIYTHYQAQGLEVLSITGDNPFRASAYLASKGYHPTVLFDIDGKVGKAYHVDELRPEGMPRTFVYNREGKLVAQSIDVSTQRQLFTMLGLAGLQPNK
jgi:peroxiredoxin